MFDHPLYRAILDRPDDDQSRLVFADWLEEQGNAHGEFIRVQLEVAEAKQNLQQPSQRLIDRESQLLQSHLLTWTQELCEQLQQTGGLSQGDARSLISHILFFRGLPSWIGTSASELLKHGDLLMQTAPWQYIRLNCRDGEPAKLATWKGLQKIRTLTMTGAAYDAADVLESPFLNQLETLVVTNDRSMKWKARILAIRKRGGLKELQKCKIQLQAIDLDEGT